MTNPRLSLPDAARVARCDDEQLRTALASGDLRDLRLSTVRAWARARVATSVAKALRP